MEESQSEKVLLEWKFRQREVSRGKFWFLGLGVLSAILLLIAIFTANFLFAMFIVLFVLISFLNYNQKQEFLHVKITERGIFLENLLIPFRELKSFWILYNPPEIKKLYFEKKSAWTPVFSLSLENVDPIELRELLLIYLEEDLDQEEETFEDQLGRFLKL